MDKNKMVKRIWAMAFSVYMLICLLIFFFADYRNQVYTTAWWVTLVCLCGAIITGIIYIGYTYLLYYINKHTEDNNG